MAKIENDVKDTMHGDFWTGPSVKSIKHKTI